MREKRVTFWLIYLIIIFIASEMIARALIAEPPPADNTVVHRYSNNTVIGYELIPNASGIYFGAYVKINSKGLRDHEYSREKEKSAYRIASVGDSFAFGAGIPMEESYTKILEKKLDECYQVINFGVAGYNTEQEVELIRTKVLAYKPDMIIVSYVLNDIQPSNASVVIKTANRTGIVRDIKEFVFRNSRLIGFFGSRISSFFFEPDIPDVASQYNADYSNTALLANLRQHFDELSRISNGSKIPILIVIIPHTSFSNYRFRHIHEIVRSSAESSGLSAIDLLPSYEGRDAERLVVHPIYNRHFNKAGNEIFASALYDYVRNRTSC